MKRALDISKHQSTFNAQTAKAQGIEVVICRCAYAASKDIRWDTFTTTVQAAGMPLMAYGFLTAHYASKNGGNLETARAVMQQQVNVWIDLCKQKGCNTLAVDQELEGNYVMGLSKDANTTLLIEACQMIEAAGLNTLLYASASWIQGRVDLTRFKYPLWVAYYYNDPKDPDFDNCTPIEQVNTSYGRWMVSLGDQLWGWQFGRIGYGSKYGVGSANVDRDFIYSKEEKPMDFKPITGKVLVCTSAAKPTCETFSEPNVNASLSKLELDQQCDIIAIGDNEVVGGMTGTWYKILNNGTEEYCLYLPDGRCRIEDKPVEPAFDLTEVLKALDELKNGQKTISDKIQALDAKFIAAGKALEG